MRVKNREIRRRRHRKEVAIKAAVKEAKAAAGVKPRKMPVEKPKAAPVKKPAAKVPAAKKVAAPKAEAPKKKAPAKKKVVKAPPAAE